MSQARGRPPHPDVLTPAEWEVLNLVRHGVRNAEIARLRKTSVDAVKFHVANILMKLEADGRADLKAFDGVPADSALHGRKQMPEAQLGPIGQIAREVSNIREAERWYKEVLRLPHLFTFGNLAFFDCGGTRLFLTPPENGAAPKAQSVLYFRVSGIHDTHKALAERGVKFQGAPHLIHRHADGTEEWMAFFEDPDGNYLALMEQVKPVA
jgi:DNA-binding CsgD family transcriptional regulator/catechol 2,3-dioxygenase-like lactoylglutathione lyase family enzyme